MELVKNILARENIFIVILPRDSTILLFTVSVFRELRLLVKEERGKKTTRFSNQIYYTDVQRALTVYNLRRCIATYTTRESFNCRYFMQTMRPTHSDQLYTVYMPEQSLTTAITHADRERRFYFSFFVLK